MVCPESEDHRASSSVVRKCPQPGTHGVRVAGLEGLLRLVDAEHDSGVRAEGPGRCERTERVRAGGADHRRAPLERERRGQAGLHQGRLAAPGRPGEHEQRRHGEASDAGRDVVLAAEERVHVLGVVRGQAGPRAGRTGGPYLVVRRERRRLLEDGALEVGELRPGIQAELLAEDPTRRADRGQRVGLSTAAVLRQREGGPPGLPPRELTGQDQGLGHDLMVPTGGQHCREPLLLRGQVQLGEPDRLQLRGRPLLELGQWPASPQAQRLLEGGHRPLGRPLGQPGAGPRHQLLELDHVQVDPLGTQPVAGRTGLDRLGAQYPPQPADTALDHFRPRRGRPVRPQHVREGIGGHPLTAAHRQGRQNQPVPGSQRRGARFQLQRAQQSHPHPSHCPSACGTWQQR